MKKNITYILIFFLSFFIIFVLYKSLNKENVYIPEKVLNEKISNFSSKDLFSEKIIKSEDFILNENSQKILDFFNCESPKDSIAELLYIIANLYSSERDYQLSNFYLKIVQLKELST